MFTSGEQISSKNPETASVPSYECMNKPMKCPNCSVAVHSEKWNDRKYLMERAEGKSYLFYKKYKIHLSYSISFFSL